MIRKVILVMFVASFVFGSTVVLATPESEMEFFNIRNWAHQLTRVEDFADVTGNRLLSCGQLNASAVSGKMCLVSPVDYAINGVIYHKDATSNFWDLTAERNIPAGAYLLVLFTINADGTSSYVTPATWASTEALALAKLGVKDGMGYPEDQAVVGYMVIGNETIAHDWDAVDLDYGGTQAAALLTIYNGYPQTKRIVNQ